MLQTFAAPALGCCLAVAALTVGATDRVTAERAAQASADLSPGDDIAFDYRGESVQVADLDGDGRDEVVYVLAASCVGANFDCPNRLTVMTALVPGDKRAWPTVQGNRYEDALFAEVRGSGYANDASVQIPGEVVQIRVSGNRVAVHFNATLDSPKCLRSTSTAHGRIALKRCPAPGRYVYTYAWTLGKLTRITP